MARVGNFNEFKEIEFTGKFVEGNGLNKDTVFQ